MRVDIHSLQSGPTLNFLQQEVQALAGWSDPLLREVSYPNQRVCHNCLPFLHAL